ncbi:MAG: hypothetical protein AAGG09_05465 [Pseudomonadota bacterium]
MAKKKSPAELKEEGTALNTLITMARKRDHNFAMLIGKEGLVLEADPKKPADAMRRKAKAAGGGSKGAQGVMRVNGKVVEFVCDADDPPRTLTQMAKVHFRERGQKVKIMIMTASGAAMEDDEDDDDGIGVDGAEMAALEPEAAPERAAPADGEVPAEDSAEATMAPSEDAAPAPGEDAEADLRARLWAEFEELQPRIAAAIESAATGIGKKATKLAETFEADIETGAEKAAKVLTLLRSTLDKAGIEAGARPASPAPADGAAPPAGAEAPAAQGDTGDTGDGVLGDIGESLSSMFGSLGLPETMEAAVESVQRTLGVSEFPETPEAAMASLGSAFESVMTSLSETYDTVTGNPRAAERNAIAAQQERLNAAYAALATDPMAAVRIAEELTRLTTMMQTAAQIAELDDASPDAAAAAREAMAGFDAELGPGTPVTPELLAQLEAERAAAQTRVDNANAAYDAAEAMPEGPERDAAIDAALDEMSNASAELDAAEVKQRAAKGKQQLTEAITVGPLSPAAPRPFSDESAAQFVEAYARRPDLASFATETAATSQNPDAIASGMGMLCDHIDNGFADGAGNLPPEGFDGAAYARNLVTGANAEGGAFMQDAETYIEGGGHLVDEPIPLAARPPHPPAGASREEIAAWEREDRNLRSRERTHFISDAVMSPEDGTIDTQSEAAQQAMGHLRFNPDVIDEPTSEVNARVADMYDMLSDDGNRQRAEGILQGVDQPRGTGAALVGRSSNLNETVANPTAEDARQSVMMSLMTPVFQGDVGSCFATAGVRRMSELNPLDAMQQYADIAETGQYRPANGQVPIPAVISFEQSEDPLIRSLEYSAATAVTAMPGNWPNTLMQHSMSTTMNALMGPVGTGTEAESAAGSDNWTVDEAIIRRVLDQSFMVEYDALEQSAEQAADGSSDHGGYFLIQIQGPGARRHIKTRAIFVEAVTERVLAALSLPADDPRVAEITAAISADATLDAMATADGDAPWNLGGGGFAREADEILFGEARENVNIIGTEGSMAVAPATQGERAEAVVENLLEQFDGTDEEMIAIRTAGIHSFNGLPDHPSLEPLLEGGNIEENMEEHLLAPGRDIASTALPEHHLETMLSDFRDRMTRFDRGAPADRQALLTRAQSANVITGEMTPGALRDALLNAYSDYLDKVSADIAQGWMDDRIANGTATTEAQRDSMATQNRARYVGYMNDWLTNSSASVTPVPTFTIADSNWGSPEGRTEFIVAPDPVSGEPRVYRRELPSGEMRLAGDSWEDAQWMEIAVDE